MIDFDESRRKRVLLVDDSAAERDLYELVLGDRFDVATAARGDDALKVATEEHFDAVILDVWMPGLDGWSVCRGLKGHRATSEVPVIMLTGDDTFGEGVLERDLQAAAVLIKPCPADKLLSTVLRVCSPL